MKFRLMIQFILLIFTASVSHSSEAPWGRASLTDSQYEAQKVVYDVGAKDLAEFSFVVDRVSFLKNLYQANTIDTSIVLVMHGNEVPFFAVENYDAYADLMKRVSSLAIDGTIEFRMCAQAVRLAHGLDPEDIHGFVKIVPMADAEIIKLQQKDGYVYMR